MHMLAQPPLAGAAQVHPLAAAPLQMQPPQPPPTFSGSFGPPSGVPLQRQAQLGPLGDGLMQPPPAQTPPAASLQKPPLPQMQTPTSQQQQQQQSPGGPLSGVPLQRPAAQPGPPSGGRTQPGMFPDPAVFKPLQPIAPLTLPPTAAQPRPVMQSGGQIQAPGDALQSHAQPPLQGHPVAFQQPPQTQSLQALQDQLQQQQRVMVGAKNASGFRETGGAAAGNAGPTPAAVPQSAFAASAGFPAGGPRSGLPRRLQVLPRVFHLLCQSLLQAMLPTADTLCLSPNLDRLIGSCDMRGIREHSLLNV